MYNLEETLYKKTNFTEGTCFNPFICFLYLFLEIMFENGLYKFTNKCTHFNIFLLFSITIRVHQTHQPKNINYEYYSIVSVYRRPKSLLYQSSCSRQMLVAKKHLYRVASVMTTLNRYINKGGYRSHKQVDGRGGNFVYKLMHHYEKLVDTKKC